MRDSKNGRLARCFPRRPSGWTPTLASALLLMVPLDVLPSLAMDAYLPALPEMPAALGTSAAMVQLSLSLYMAVLGLGQLLFGPLSDRLGRRPVALAGLALFSLASVGLALAGGGAVFLAWRELQGLGGAAMLGATFATVRDVYAQRPEAGTLYGLFGAVLAAVPALGPILGALVTDHLGWRALFLLLAGLSLLAGAQVAWRWPETRPDTRPPNRPHPVWRDVLASADFWTGTLAFSAAMGVFFVFFSIAPRVLMVEAGLSRLQFSLAFASVAGVLMLGSRLARGPVGRWGPRGSLARGLLALQAGALLLGLLVWAGAPVPLVFMLAMGGMAVGMVFIVSVSANIALNDFGHAAGTAVALYYGMQSLVVGVAGTACVLAWPGADPGAWPLVLAALVLPLPPLRLAWKRGSRR